MKRRNQVASSSARAAAEKPFSISLHGSSHSKPFQYLHSVPEANLALSNYDALLDQNASHYFTSASLMKHCHYLEQVATHPRCKEKSTSLIKMGHNLHLKRKQVQNLTAKLEHKHSFIENEVIKVNPYASNLKSCSRAKFDELKKNLNQKLLIKQQQHQRFLKTQYNIKIPQKPQIRMVNTLEPIQNIRVVNKEYIRTHKLLERSRIAHSVNA